MKEMLSPRYIIAFSLIIFIMVGIVSGTVLLQNNLDNRNQAAEEPDIQSSIELLNNGLLVEIAKVKQEKKAGRNAEVSSVTLDKARERKGKMKKLAQENPAEFLAYALPEEVLSDIPPELDQFVESYEVLQGDFDWHILENPEEGIKEDRYYLTESETNTEVRIYSVADSPPPFDAVYSDVSLPAIVLDEVAVISDFSDIVAVESLNATEKNPFVLGAGSTHTLKVAVILATFNTGTQTQNTTVDQARGTVFTNANSANSFLQNASFGKIALAGKNSSQGDVYGWYSVNLPSGQTPCNDYRGAHAAAVATAQQSGVNLSGYDLTMVSWPRTAGCWWVGMAMSGDGKIAYDGGIVTPYIIAHETLHHFNLGHANAYQCQENGVKVAISDPANCTHTEYGDPFDVMGHRMYHPNANSKSITASISSSTPWIPNSNVQTLDRATNQDGVYRLYPIGTQASGLQILKIPRSLPTSQYGYSGLRKFALEFRQPHGFDNLPPSNPLFNGVSIRLIEDEGGASSRLVDTTPGSVPPSTPNYLRAEFADAPLTVGSTFFDARQNISITTLAVTEQYADVQVTFTGPPPCYESRPGIIIERNQWGEWLNWASGTINTPTEFNRFGITNNSSSGCPSLLIQPWIESSTLTSAPASLPSLTLSPGQTINPRTFTLNSLPGATVGWNNFTFHLNVPNHPELSTQTLGRVFYSNPPSGPTPTPTRTIAPTRTPTPTRLPTPTRTPTPTRVVTLPPSTTPTPTQSGSGVPEVWIVLPSEGAVLPSSGKVSVTVHAWDDVKVSKIQVFQNSSRIKECKNTTQCVATIDVKRLKAGTYIFRATAQDNVNNQAIPHQITVYK